MNVPAELRYTKDHEWVRETADGWVVGITDFAQGELGDVVFVDLPPVGKVVTKGETLCVVESVKAASDVYAPISGTVKIRNEVVASKPELLNNEPYAQGWLVVLDQVSDTSELLVAADYQRQIGG